MLHRSWIYCHMSTSVSEAMNRSSFLWMPFWTCTLQTLQPRLSKTLPLCMLRWLWTAAHLSSNLQRYAPIDSRPDAPSLSSQAHAPSRAAATIASHATDAASSLKANLRLCLSYPLLCVDCLCTCTFAFRPAVYPKACNRVSDAST